MIDLTTIPDEVLRARGSYSTVRQAHEAKKKHLNDLCDELMRLAPRISKCGQSDDKTDIYSARSKAADALDIINLISSAIEEALELSAQRAELKSKAWPK